MKLQTKLVAVKRINSSLARSSFSADAIEKVAHLMINAEGIINPIILRQHSLESYEVIDGHFEYHAAVRAKEISLLKGETVQAIILEPDNEETILEQVNILRRNAAPISLEVTEESTYTREVINPDQVINLDAQFVNLEKIFKAQFDELQRSNRHLESRISELATQKPKLDLGEELINQIATKVVESIQPLLSFPQPKQVNITESKKTKEMPIGFPIDLNTSSENELARLPGIKKGIPALIIKRINTQGVFSRIEELVEINSVGRATIEKWRNYLIVQESNN
jgi:DNA uptake protein ComE-like DNA-binding protein